MLKQDLQQQVPGWHRPKQRSATMRKRIDSGVVMSGIPFKKGNPRLPSWRFSFGVAVQAAPVKCRGLITSKIEATNYL
jgi:hypothetical protein